MGLGSILTNICYRMVGLGSIELPECLASWLSNTILVGHIRCERGHYIDWRVCFYGRCGNPFLHLIWRQSRAFLLLDGFSHRAKRGLLAYDISEGWVRLATHLWIKFLAHS